MPFLVYTIFASFVRLWGVFKAVLLMFIRSNNTKPTVCAFRVCTVYQRLFHVKQPTLITFNTFELIIASNCSENFVFEKQKKFHVKHYRFL